MYDLTVNFMKTWIVSVLFTVVSLVPSKVLGTYSWPSIFTEAEAVNTEG